MRKILIKVKRCKNCTLQFIGSIDPLGEFCSGDCQKKFKEQGFSTQWADEQKRLHIRVKSPVVYPFHCRICNLLVQEGPTTKSHRKGKCFKSCTGKASKILNKREEKKKLKLQKKLQAQADVDPKFIKESEIKEKLYGKSFYTSAAWLQLRYLALSTYGRRCHCCNAIDCVVHVDHIKPRSKYPELALNLNNLQVLCEACNLGKGNWDETDWRNK